MTEIASCPVCGAGGTHAFEQRDLLCHVEGLFGQRYCADCGVYFLSPRVPESAIDRYYPRSYESYQEDTHPPLVRKLAWALGLAQRKRRIVEKFIRGGRLLDVGCGNGFFLRTMSGEQWDLHAMDIKRNEKFGFSGPFHEGCFDHEAPPFQDMDAVTLFHVFEHLYHPREALKNAAAVLKPGGLLFLALPDLKNIERQVFGKYWVGWDVPRHIAIYSRSALTILLRESGFELIAVVPDVCTGELMLKNADFVLSARGIESGFQHFLPLRVALAPLTWSLSRLGLAPAKVYVARR
jgi:SAM-dependent methyltransferase